MSYFGDADIDTMLETFGVPVVLGSTTVNGIRDIADEELYRGDTVGVMSSKGISVTVKTGALPGLAEGASITVEAVSYRVMRVFQINDGALTQALCAKT